MASPFDQTNVTPRQVPPDRTPTYLAIMLAVGVALMMSIGCIGSVAAKMFHGL